MPQIVGYGIPVDTHVYHKTDIVDLGYSFAAQGYTKTSSDMLINNRSISGWLCKYLNQGVRFKDFYALGGLTAKQIFDDYAPSVIVNKSVNGLNPGYCNVFSGGQDLLVSPTSTALNDAITWTKRTFELLVNNAIIPIANTIWINDNVMTDSLRSVLNDFNAWIIECCNSNSDLILSNYASVVVDPASATAGTLSGYLQSDGIHPAAFGCQKIAKAIADQMYIYQPNIFSGHLDDTFGSYGNLSANSTLSGTSGTEVGASGDTADGFILTGSGATVAGSKVAASAVDLFTGDWQRIALSSGANNAVASMFQTVSSGFTAGDTMYAAVEVSAASLTDVYEIFLEVKCKDSGDSTLLTVRDGQGIDVEIDDFDGVLRTYDFVIPAGTTAIDYLFGITCNSVAGGSGAATVDFRRNVFAKKYTDNVILGLDG